MIVGAVGGSIFFSQKSASVLNGRFFLRGRIEPAPRNGYQIYSDATHGISFEYPSRYTGIRETEDSVSFAEKESGPWAYTMTVSSTEAVTTLVWLADQDQLIPDGRLPKLGQLALLKVVEREGHQLVIYDRYKMEQYGDDTLPFMAPFTEVAVVHDQKLFILESRYSKLYQKEEIDPVLLGMAGSFHFLKNGSGPVAIPRDFPQPENIDYWKTYTNASGGFSFLHPPEIAVEAHEGSSDFEKKFVSVDIGTPEYLRTLKDADATEGPPLFLRMTASEPNEQTDSSHRIQPGDCGEYQFTEYISVGGLRVAKCEGMMMGAFPSFRMVFKKDPQDPTIYVIESMRYEGRDQMIIERIISTIRFTDGI